MDVIQLSSKKFIIGCIGCSILAFILGFQGHTSSFLLAAEVLITILSLFVFGSFRYQLDKNALTYGAGIVIVGTFIPLWWPNAWLRQSWDIKGWTALVDFVLHHFFTLEGLDDLFHADTMLFILGLTYFVAVIAQTRLLESISSFILGRQKGRLFPTVALLTGLVAAASGILDGVSMIGLMIRTLVIILALGHAEARDIIYAVIISTVITTVSGMWMAYGEPPNLIMKANLYPHLDNTFFLRYCLPAAFGSYVIVAWNLRSRLGKRRIDLQNQDILDAHNADVRFIQASRHGEVFTAVEFVENQQEELGAHYIPVHARVLAGEPLGEALIREEVSSKSRRMLLGHFVHEDLAEALEKHYQHLVHHETLPRDKYELQIKEAIEGISQTRRHAQDVGAIAFIPFVGLLVYHGMHHEFPLFAASFAGFIAAILGIYKIPKMRALALLEAKHEYKEYLFLFPLFLAITLLQKVGFFDELAHLLQKGIQLYGISHVAYIQYWAACILSAILDNNVVADFASKALHGLHLGTLHLFSMAQIAGYAIGGCWTHIGCAQSVVAFSFIRKEISPRYTPVQWMKSMTVIILEMSLLVTLLVYLEGWLLSR